ncbi:MAG: diphosphomevalonate decarboxylase [Anaerolineae bacterium]|jgi:diphosphomevalonate decarboxylase|nr:diphosphomevalonate decarboxylase [Anaerolineae bacterium]
MTEKKLFGAAAAHPNIAFIKYWGNIDDEMRLAANDSISMNLAALETCTSVEFVQDGSIDKDTLMINDTRIVQDALNRVSKFLDIAREKTSIHLPARVISVSNFPMGTGIASSAAAFAALAMAASEAAGLPYSSEFLSRYARRGSGSACRSIPGGFVEWKAGATDETSYATSFADVTHWDLVDCIAIISEEHKSVGSTAGHAAASTSPLQTARLADSARRFQACRQAILDQDFSAFAEVVEQDSTMMHSVMMTSNPPLFYWAPASLHLMKVIPQWRRNGIPVCYTLDAGANVHAITTQAYAKTVEESLLAVHGVKSVQKSNPGGGTHLCIKK